MDRLLPLSMVALLCAGCAPTRPEQPQQQPLGAEAVAAPEPVRLPTGATLEPTGFLTIEQVPPSPAVPEPPRRQGELTYYAELAGISNAEAAMRLKEQEQARPEFQRVIAELRRKERGNYVDAELIHRPDWAYLLFFKRDPQRTLAKYTRNPRLQARSAQYGEAELRALTKPWIDRLIAERLMTGYGVNARHGRAEVDMVVSEEEFAAIAASNGWGPVPETVQLKFDGAPIGPAVDAAVAPRIRIFPQSDRNLGATNQAALGGRIVLRDGCLFVAGRDGKDQLAYFAREVGLGFDELGYLSLRTRTATPRHLGRVGEDFTWAGPIGIDDAAPMVGELRQLCGNAPLMHAGIPDSTTKFNARYGLPRPPPPPPPPMPRR